jgi:hypothetical protein
MSAHGTLSICSIISHLENEYDIQGYIEKFPEYNELLFVKRIENGDESNAATHYDPRFQDLLRTR